MAEVKNAFIKSKMNKDLDDRLLPPGEYRDGQNIQVSKSEGEDVGALENAVGNLPAVNSENQSVDFSVLAGLSPGALKSIGVYADTNTSTIYVFLTDYTEESINNITYSSTANNFIYSYNTLTLQTSKIAEGSFLNFSTTNPIYGINVLENLLFWTDNRNQPRKINLDLANNGLYYTSEDLISVAKYNPYQAINLYYNAPELSGAPASSYQDVTSEFLPDGITANPFYNTDWPGDKDYLKDKFVTFSYRFKFTDGEYSIMAPFTQEAFIPKQDGYFLGENEEETYRSTVVRFMENKANDVKLFIPLPYQANELNNLLGVEAIDILYKESDSLAVKVLDTVLNSTFSYEENKEDKNTTLFYSYDYQSRKPYKTLPESEIIRVYDKVPVRAFGQEVISNRIVYSNFQDKHTPPETMDYDVAVTPKDEFNLNGNTATHTTSAVEYPMHTVKQNRNYQVGFVLSDRYGRQSTTILSPVSAETKQDENITFGGSTFFHPYTANPGVGNNSVNSWAGDSLKVLVNQAIPSDEPNLSTGWPGLYNGDPSSSKYNPLGWYSYKIVVKQTEQEYYNVYLPGILDGYPDFGSQQNPPDAEDTIAHITLLGDNINKVPRDLTEVGPEQKQYRSDVRLYGRVSPERNDAPAFTVPYYPQTNYQEPVAIAEQDYIFADAATDAPYGTVYQSDSDPYIGRLTQGNVSTVVGSDLPIPIGSLQTTGNPGAIYPILLGVFETDPTTSLLDIFWETSSTGLVSDFNESAGLTGNSKGWYNFNFIQTEATEKDDDATTEFSPKIDNGFEGEAMRYSNVTLLSAFDGLKDVTSSWSLVKILKAGQPDAYKLVVQKPMYYSTNPLERTFTFNFRVQYLDQNGNIISTFEPMSITNNVLINISPTINPVSPQSYKGDRITAEKLFTLSGTNGFVGNDNTSTSADLVFTLAEQIPNNPPLTIDGDNVYEETGTATGNYTAVFQVTDSGGATAKTDKVDILFGKSQMNETFGTASNVNISGGLESVGVYWASEYTTGNCITENPIPDSLANSTDGREAYDDLSLNPTALASSSVQKEEVDSKYIDRADRINEPGLPYRWKNSNYKPSHFSGKGADDSSLKEGTAFIKVDFRFNSFARISPPGENGANFGPGGGTDPEGVDDGIAPPNYPPAGRQFGVVWVAYLQYKPASANANWQQAIDIEGNPIRFGSSQANGLDVRQDGFFQTGALTNNSRPIGYSNVSFDKPIASPEVANPQDMVQATAPYPDSGQIPNASTASRVFAFGESQSYDNVPNTFGEYRLLIKYPQSINNSFFEKRPREKQNMIAPSPTAKQSAINEQFFAIRGTEQVDGNIDVTLSFGDFYYVNNNTSFSYKVSQTGSIDAATASINQPQNLNQVWAREWAAKYVTQFYTDPQLTIPWNPNSDGSWYSFAASNTNDGSNSIAYNAQNGFENSFTNGISNQEEPYSDLYTKYPITPASLGGGISNRRWVAEFSATGEKIKGSAIPSSGNVEDI